MTAPLAQAVLAPGWTMAGALAQVKPHEVSEAIQSAESSMIPLHRQFTPASIHDSKEGKAIGDAVRAIGAKLEPRMSGDEASTWRRAIVMSLMKWPARVALAAAKRGIMERYPFGIRDVDAKLHELAEEIEARQRLALWRLEQMRAEIERAANPLPAIEEKPHIWTQEEIDIANHGFRRLGLRTRYRLAEGGACENFEVPLSQAEEEKEEARARQLDARQDAAYNSRSEPTEEGES